MLMTTGDALCVERTGHPAAGPRLSPQGPARDPVEQFLRAAVAAPSMHNIQPWLGRPRDANRVINLHADPARQLAYSGSADRGEASDTERELHAAIERRHTTRHPFSAESVPQGVLAERTKQQGSRAPSCTSSTTTKQCGCCVCSPTPSAPSTPIPPPGRTGTLGRRPA